MSKSTSIYTYSEILSLKTSEISENPNQPRKAFAEESIIKLANSIRQYGIIEPLVVRFTEHGYELISGERRLRAAREIGLTTVPCVTMATDEKSSAEIAIIENLLREDLNIFEEASAIEALIDTHSMTQEEIAKKLCVSQPYIANKLRILRLTKSEREEFTKNKLTERHARALVRIANEDDRKRILNAVIANQLNVSKTEELVNSYFKKDELAPNERKYKHPDDFKRAILRTLSQANASGLKVKSKKIENEEHTEIIILIPKQTSPSAQNIQSAEENHNKETAKCHS